MRLSQMMSVWSRQSEMKVFNLVACVAHTVRMLALRTYTHNLSNMKVQLDEYIGNTHGLHLCCLVMLVPCMGGGPPFTLCQLRCVGRLFVDRWPPHLTHLLVQISTRAS